MHEKQDNFKYIKILCGNGDSAYKQMVTGEGCMHVHFLLSLNSQKSFLAFASHCVKFVYVRGFIHSSLSLHLNLHAFFWVGISSQSSIHKCLKNDVEILLTF